MTSVQPVASTPPVALNSLSGARQTSPKGHAKAFRTQSVSSNDSRREVDVLLFSELIINVCRPCGSFHQRKRKSGDLVCDFLEDFYFLIRFKRPRIMKYDEPGARLVEGLRSQTNLLHCRKNPRLVLPPRDIKLLKVKPPLPRNVAAARRWHIMELT